MWNLKSRASETLQPQILLTGLLALCDHTQCRRKATWNDECDGDASDPCL